jgi:exopolysaccharide biosynthesis polyprenyl glycosylphosphotransferase
MADMLHSVRDTARDGWGSRYARMIPGTPGIRKVAPSTRKWPTADFRKPAAVREIARPEPTRIGSWASLLLPRPNVADRLALFQLAFLDFLVLLITCLVPSVVLPARSLLLLEIPVYAVLLILLAFTEGLYQKVGMTVSEEFPILARSALFAMVLVLVAAWNRMQPLDALTSLIPSLGGLVLWRQIRRTGWNRHFIESGSRNVLIVGAGPAGRSIARGLRDDPNHPATVVGFLDDEVPLSPQVLGRVEDLDWLSRSQFIDEVILAVPNDPVLVQKAAEVAFCNHLDIRAVPNLPPGLWPEASVERIGGIPVIALHRESLPSATLMLKRLIDVMGSLLGLMLIGPFMALLAMLVRLDSPGPVFYIAERTGAKGRPFRCYKFRSMAADAERMKESLRARNQREGPIFKLKDDPRITRFGGFLRRYSLDELPQLWNVFCGEMSLVGPRPHPVDEVNHYELHHYRRLDMKPGITGLWQITARNSPSFDLNMHLDLTYIENWTLQLDLQILLKTAHVLFSPHGA